MHSEGVAQQLAHFVSTARYEDLPPNIILSAKHLLIDIVGVAIAGWSTNVGRIPACTKLALGGVPESTVLGTSEKISRTSAAYANVALGTALEADDTLFFLGHHGPGVVLPVLAVAEAGGYGGKAVLTAITVGYEISGRLARSSVYVRRAEDDKIEVSPVVGTNYGAIAAAAAIANLTGLDPRATASALGIAAYHTTIPTSGRMVAPPRPHMKYNAYAAMAEAGVLAVMLASQGFTGDDAILDGDGDGDWFAMAGSLEPKRALLVKELGENWLISSLSYKRYPSCRFTHGAIDLVLKLMNEHEIAAPEITAVDAYVSVHNFAMKMDRTLVRNEVDAQFSLPYALAVAMLGVPPGPAWMAPLLWTDPEVADVMAKINLHRYPESDRIMLDGKLSGTDFRRPARVVLTARGQSWEAATDYFSGDPWTDQTRFDEAAVIAKFNEYTAAADAKARSAFVASVLMLETQDQVGALAGALTVAP
jgi:2-methylcitrate dehydratase PrpD